MVARPSKRSYSNSRGTLGRIPSALAGALVLWVFLWSSSWAHQSGLVWSSFVGGSAAENGYDIALDGSGGVWVTGYTESADFPSTAGAFVATAENRDVFVIRLVAQGSEMSSSIVFGGSNLEEGMSMTLDGSGCVYVTGYTRSMDFPVTAGALDSIIEGDSDAFVVKLEPAGGNLSYSTLLGGGGADYGRGIAVDNFGRALVIGATDAADFPATAGSFDESFNGGTDVFVARLDPWGSALDFATFLGGGLSDYGWGIALDVWGGAHLVGYTYSPDFPTTENALDTLHSGPSDVFVAKLDSSGGELDYATFLGGNHLDAARSIAVDGWGSAHVTGYTFSQDFPVTPGAFDSALDPYDVDAFVAKLNPDGSALEYATFLGGERVDSGYGVALDSSGKACVVGFTESENFPISAGAVEAVHNGERDVFVTLLGPSGDLLEYSTFLGGAEDDYAWDVVLDGWGDALVAGYTRSVDFPTTSGAFRETSCGAEDVFVTRLSLSDTPVEPQASLTGLPKGYVLDQNYPNPFNASTEIRYRIPQADHVTLRIFNSLGQEVCTLRDTYQKASEYAVPWDGRNAMGRKVASGTYFYALTGRDFRAAKKMIVLR